MVIVHLPELYQHTGPVVLTCNYPSCNCVLDKIKSELVCLSEVEVMICFVFLSRHSNCLSPGKTMRFSNFGDF